MDDNGSHVLSYHPIVLRRQHKPSRLRAGAAAFGGEIVEVQGGHIIRSTGRKDRHSKVCTSKGPRDRRVRLAAHTAIQFYDVQDRLGYDRPSKAVDWLMKNAKSAIDELAQLPAWKPTTMAMDSAGTSAQDFKMGKQLNSVDECEHAVSPGFSFGEGEECDNSEGFLPPSMNSDAMADTIKSFFPVAASATATNSSAIGFQDYQQATFVSSNNSNLQDLRLSLQSFSNSVFHPQNGAQSAYNSLFSSSGHSPFDTVNTNWLEQNQKMAWNGLDTGNSCGFVFNAPAPAAAHKAMPQFISQREPLQSSNLPFARAWAMEPVAQNLMVINPNAQHLVHPSVASYGLGPDASFSGFHVPARLQGEEEHRGIANNLASNSSEYNH